MKAKPWVLATIFVAMLANGSRADAQGENSGELQRSAGEVIAARRHGFAANAGLFSPVGHLGLTYAYAPSPQLQVELGAGLGFTGLQLSAMPKMVLGGIRHHFVAGAGISVSAVRTAFSVSPSGSGTPVWWLNVDAVGYQFRSVSGFSFLVSGGVSVGLGGGTVHVPSFVGAGNSREVRGIWFPQARVAFGYWL